LRNRYEDESRAKGRQDWSGIRFVLTQRLLAGLLMLAGLTPCPLRAQTNAARATPPSERCLLIVETSKSMQRRADAVLGAVQDLLKSGLNGEFRDGGTLGVWTFNEDLSAGRFPLQTWSSSAQKDITQRTLTFLKGQKYEKQANFDKVAPALSRVIYDSELITVILVSSGDGKVRGTPFDDRINGAYLQWHAQQQKARMPFVTVLRARHGQVAQYIVNTPPWPLQVPRLSEGTNSAETPHDKLLEALHTAASPTVPPLIVSEQKLQPEPVPEPKPEPVAAKPEAPPPVAVATITNQPTIIKPPEQAAAPVEVAKTEPVPVVPEKAATESPPNAIPVPIPASKPKTEPVQAPEAKPAEPAPPKPEPAPPPPAPMPKPEPVAVEQPKPSPAPEVKTEPVPAPPATHESPPAAAQSATAEQPAPSHPSSLEPPPPSRPAPSAQNATAVPAESLLRRGNIWIAALLMAIVALGFGFLLMRRSRAAPQASLITRSFERDKKP